MGHSPAAGKTVNRQPLKRQVSYQFKLDTGLFLAGALALGTYNLVRYNFPWKVAVKSSSVWAFWAL
nr:hypothetical protein [Aliamphritea spongicola]